MGGLYRLGPAAARLGLAALAQLDILELAREEMARLSAVTGNTVFLSIWSGNGPTVINRFDGEKVAPLEIRVGAVMSLLGSATGKAFLAWQPQSVTKNLLARELTDAARHADVAAMIDRVRGSGLSVIHGMVVPGIFAVAAPIFDHEGGLRCVMTAIDEAAGDYDAPTEVAYALNESARAVSCAAGHVNEKEEATEPI
jgi:DNA-binding IclR family transcriptional regulator